MIILPSGRDIVDVAGEPGPKSDITLFRENRDNFAPTQKKGDLGYLGEDLIDTPIKTPRNGKLTKTRKKKIKSFPHCEYLLNTNPFSQNISSCSRKISTQSSKNMNE